MTLAERILNEINAAQTRADEACAKAKAEYEEAKKKYDTAFAAQLACQGENCRELSNATAYAEGAMREYEKWYYFHKGRQDEAALLSYFIRSAIESHEAVYGEEIPA